MNPVSNSAYKNALKTIMTELFWWLGIIASQHLTKSRTQCQWRDYNQAKTTNYVKNNEARLDFARNHLKECTVLKIKSLDRWNKGTRVPGWWEKEKVWRDTTLSVKRGGGSVMAWLCMADGGTRSLVLTDDDTLWSYSVQCC